MRIGGLAKLTLLDFPGHTACTVFTNGCNFRCPFCYNLALIGLDPDNLNELSEEDFFNFLKKRQGLLDGVAITGGEPTLQPDLKDFITKIKNLGFAVKLDTNGTNPLLLKDLVESGLVDYVAMDIKNSFDKYDVTAGNNRYQKEILESITYLLENHVDYEFRTTVVNELHSEDDFEKIGKLIKGCQHYYLQKFTNKTEVVDNSLTSPSIDQMHHYLEIVKKYIDNAELRGI